ncbi:MAG: POTRA domain-containing protein [Saprospiraceae bacterium]
MLWFLKNSLIRNSICAGFALIALIAHVNGQRDFVILDSILIHGNKKTRRNVILHEIDFHSGDTISLQMLSGKLISNEKRLQSIGIFTAAKINVKNWKTDVNICNIDITVQENWYLYPYIIFELADRNFNVWRKEQNYSFARVNYGLALNHINLTGNKDKLKIKIQRGFTKKYEVTYDFPYLKNKWGIFFNYLYSENREIAYKTLNNKLVFYKKPDDGKLFFRHRAGIGVTHRTNAQTNQILKIEYLTATVDSVISGDLNPDYFGAGRLALNYPSLDYLFRYNNTIYPQYPTGGYDIELNFRKEGLGVLNKTNNTWISFSFEKHSSLNNRFVLSNRMKLKYNFQNTVLPYFLNYSIGYNNDNIAGYQLYVIDGRNFIISNNAIKYRLLDKDINLGDNLPRQLKIMNFKIYSRFNFDLGYASDPAYGKNNFLTNKLNYGYGPSFDIIIFNNVALSCQYGITGFGDKGFFFESGVNF